MISNLPQREEFLRKKRKRKIIKYSIISGAVILIVALASFIAHRSSIRISDIELSGGVLVTEKDLELKALEYLRGSYVWLFPKNNSLWYPKASLKKYLEGEFKRIDTIDTNLKNFKTLSIKITERKPIATWCHTTILDEQCYFIDQNGTIFATAPNFSGDAYFKYYGLVASDNPIGLEYISPADFFEITQFVESIRALSLRPQYVLAKENGEFSLFIKDGMEIYFDIKRPLSEVLSNLEALLSTPALSKAISSVEYIDLRYGNKLFYKLKE